jgi:glucan biosynthesis protein C
VPFVFGSIVIAAPQVYIVLLQQPGYSQNYLQYYGYIFSTTYLTEVTAGSVGPAKIVAYTLEPAHLWFILYLFVFSLVCLPLFLRLRDGKGKGFKDRVASLLSKRGGHLTLRHTDLHLQLSAHRRRFPLPSLPYLPLLPGLPLLL